MSTKEALFCMWNENLRFKGETKKWGEDTKEIFSKTIL